MSFPNRANRRRQIPRDMVVVVAVYAELPVHFDMPVFLVAAASFSFVVRVADVLTVVVVAVGCTILIGGFLLLW